MGVGRQGLGDDGEVHEGVGVRGLEAKAIGGAINAGREAGQDTRRSPLGQ